VSVSVSTKLDRARKELKDLRSASLNAYEFVEQLTFLLFLKMAYERSQPPFSEDPLIESELDWSSIAQKAGEPLERHYDKVLSDLGHADGLVGLIFRQARNETQLPVTLKDLITNVVGSEPSWIGIEVEEKGSAFENLLREAAKVVGSKASQFYTNRVLIDAVVAVMQPRPGMTIADPACGTGGFLVAARDYIAENYSLDRDEKEALLEGIVRGFESIPAHARLAMMNLLLHGIGRLANDYAPCVEIRDPLSSPPTEHFDLVITNPPFGSESREASSRGDFWVETRSNPLGYLQQAWSMLEMDGRAAVFVPDGVLFEGGAAETVRRRLLEECDLHTLLRMPDGTSYASSKANVLFFDRRHPSSSGEPLSKELWVYDLRTFSTFTPVKNPIKPADVQDFVECFMPGARHERDETERFGCWAIEDLLARDNTNLDLWPAASRPEPEPVEPPDVVARRILGMLSSAYLGFAEVAAAVGVSEAEIGEIGQSATETERRAATRAR
jgi:type I restriction enzyme M protein